MTREELQELLADIADRATEARRLGKFDHHADNMRAALEGIAKLTIAIHDLTPEPRKRKPKE